MYESILLKATIPGLGNVYKAGICRPPNTPLDDFTHFISSRSNIQIVVAGYLQVTLILMF